MLNSFHPLKLHHNAWDNDIYKIYTILMEIKNMQDIRYFTYYLSRLVCQPLNLPHLRRIKYNSDSRNPRDLAEFITEQMNKHSNRHFSLSIICYQTFKFRKLFEITGLGECAMISASLSTSVSQAYENPYIICPRSRTLSYHITWAQ